MVSAGAESDMSFTLTQTKVLQLLSRPAMIPNKDKEK
jgi:hypothetical protein